MEFNAISSFGLTTVFTLFWAIGMAQSSSTDLETTFKSAFGKFKQAVIAKDIEQVRMAMAASSYMTLKNQLTAHKLNFAKDFCEGMAGKIYSGIDLTALKTLRVLENKNTGMLIMLAPKSAKFDPFEMGDDFQPMLLGLSFIKENDAWKFDSMLPLTPLEETEEDKFLKGDLSMIENETYKPGGVIPPTPEEEAAPDYDYDAIVSINSFGYEVEVILNGKSLRKTQGSSGQRTGVKKGENTLVIKSVPLDGGGYDIKVVIQAMINDQPVEVFRTTAEKPEAVITKAFQVN